MLLRASKDSITSGGAVACAPDDGIVIETEDTLIISDEVKDFYNILKKSKPSSFVIDDKPIRLNSGSAFICHDFECQGSLKGGLDAQRALLK